jgi:Fe-S oxidoreductase
MLKDLITEKTPLIGIEPSAILSFRDEYPELCGPELKEDCLRLASHCLMIDEFIDKEFKAGRIKTSQFTNQPMSIKLHGHCQQKAVASTQPTISMLSIPKNYKVEEIPSGCCGMAGSFGFEKEHYDISQKVGELILFPEIRNTAENIKIAAVGTSCRNQIFEGTGRRAFHPLEILWDSLV